jgi:hypothetical protein
MTADNVTTAALVLLGTVTGALAGLGPALFLAEKAERRERGRELWRRDADLCGQLEQLAGEVTDRLRSWGIRPEEYDAIGGKIAEMALLSGRFPRYPGIQQTIRDHHNTQVACGRIAIATTPMRSGRRSPPSSRSARRRSWPPATTPSVPGTDEQRAPPPARGGELGDCQ